MDKMLLTLTLLAFSSGRLCSVAYNLGMGDPNTVNTPLNKMANKLKKCPVRMSGDLRDDYVVSPGIGAHKLHTHPMMEWPWALKTCMDEGGHLAIINSDTEAKMLVDLLKEAGISNTWIGTHDLFSHGWWLTLTSETLAAAGYDGWLSTEPNNYGGNEHCGSLKISGTEAGMNDLSCTTPSPFLCEINLC